MKQSDNNRPSDRFLYLSIIFTVAIFAFFCVLGGHARRCHNDIINLYCAESVHEPGNVQLDKTMSSLLRLEIDKIQQGMIVLSVWAGVMMIVFLVFSLYSMHRSDELERESNDSLRKMKEASATIKDEADASIRDVRSKSQEELGLIHDMIDQHKKEYERMTKEKQEIFNDLLNKYKADLVTATEVFNEGVKNIISIIKTYAPSSAEEDGECSSDHII